MMKLLPEGTTIGEMRASLQWVLTHTARFTGIVIVSIQDSRGFILINQGTPLGYYFRHGNRVLKNNPAFEYFLSQPAIQFELRRYSPEDMAIAFDLFSEEDITTAKTIPHDTKEGWHPIERVPLMGMVPEAADVPPPGLVIPLEPDNKAGLPVYEMGPEEYESAITFADQVPGPETDVPFVISNPQIIGEFGIRLPVEQTEEQVVAGVGVLLLGQIMNLPGVIAVTVFRRGMNVLSIGDISVENLVDAAEDLIESARELSSLMRTGPFVQVTLRIPAGNLIIAPYFEEYLCILTNPDINLGQIRKIIREVPGHEGEWMDPGVS